MGGAVIGAKSFLRASRAAPSWVWFTALISLAYDLNPDSEAMWKKWISRLQKEASTGEVHPPREIAAAILLLECARADFDRSVAEIDAVSAALSREFGLSADELKRIIGDAEAAAEQAVSLYGPISRLNEALSGPEKRALMHCLWQVAYADHNIDPQEEHLLRQIADLMHIPHADYIQTKLEVCGTA